MIHTTSGVPPYMVNALVADARANLECVLAALVACQNSGRHASIRRERAAMNRAINALVALNDAGEVARDYRPHSAPGAGNVAAFPPRTPAHSGTPPWQQQGQPQQPQQGGFPPWQQPAALPAS